MGSRNIVFPTVDDNITGSFLSTNKIDKDALSTQLTLLLLTQPNERYYNPEYGFDLMELIFNPNDDITHSDILDKIKNTVSKYIPSLTIKNIDINTDQNDETKVNVVIRFTYDDDSFSEEDEIILRIQ